MNRDSYMSPGFQTEVQKQLLKQSDYSRVAKILAAMNIPFEDAYQLIFMRPPRALNLDFTV